MSGHRAGKKFAGSHTTLIEEAETLVDNAAKMKEVTKVVFGPIKVIKGTTQSVKFLEIMAGWKIILCGKTARQEIFLYTKDREVVKKELENQL